MLTLAPQFANIAQLPLNGVPITQGQLRLSFKQPIPVQAGGVSLNMGAQGGGSVVILSADRHVIDPDDPFGQIAIKSDETYLGLDLQFSLAPGANVALSLFGLNVSASRTLSVHCYRRFSTSAGGALPSFGKAFAETAAAFLLPQSLEELSAIDENTVLVLAGTGQFQIGGSFGVATPVRQIFLNLPSVAGQTIAFNASGSLSVDAALTLAGAYQVRVRRLGSDTCEVATYKMKSAEGSLSLSAQASIVANAGNFDLAQKFVEALSTQPVVDVREFRDALPREDVTARDLEIERFQANLESAVATTIAASVTATVSGLQSDESVLTFEADLQAPSSAARIALEKALHGDFRLLSEPASLPSGIRQTSDISSRTDLKKASLNVNLLGLVNWVSAAKLAMVSTVERAADGSITLVTDIANESRLQAAIRNLTSEPGRLRELLSEDFLLQASFTVTPLRVLPPEFSARHSFFAIDNSTNRDEMKNLLDVCRILGVLTDEKETALLANSTDFGRTTFLLRSAYNNPAIEMLLFTPDGQPRNAADYERQGRIALGALLAGDTGQEFRKSVADTSPAGNALWNKLKEVGNVAAFGPIFGASSNDPRVAAAGSDYVCISSWAEAMSATAQIVASLRTLLQGNIAVDDQRLQKARSDLRDRLAQVVKTTRGHFGEPLGVLMVFFASGRSGSMRGILTGPKIDRLDFVLPSPPLTTKATGGSRA